MTSLSVSLDKKELLAGTSNSKMYRLLANDLSFMVHTDAHAGCLNDVNFGFDSDKFVCIDENGVLKMWETSEYKTIFAASGGQLSSGSSVCIAGDDGSIIAGWRDGFIRCYNPVSQVVEWEVANAHRGAVTTIYADANYILSGGEDGAVRVWGR